MTPYNIVVLAISVALAGAAGFVASSALTSFAIKHDDVIGYALAVLAFVYFLFGVAAVAAFIGRNIMK